MCALSRNPSAVLVTRLRHTQNPDEIFVSLEAENKAQDFFFFLENPMWYLQGPSESIEPDQVHLLKKMLLESLWTT